MPDSSAEPLNDSRDYIVDRVAIVLASAMRIPAAYMLTAEEAHQLAQALREKGLLADAAN